MAKGSVLITLLFALAFALAGTAGARTEGAQAPAWFSLRGKVTRVVDGDTVHVRVGRKTQEVRLIGIDAPELGACYAGEATARMRALVAGKQVRLLGDRTQARRDRYNRLLAYVLQDGRDVGESLIASGAAQVYVFERPFQRLTAYRAAEIRGQTSRAGLWAGCAASADVALTSSASVPSVAAGGSVGYTHTVTNAGRWAIAQVMLTVNVSAGASISSFTASQGTCTQAGSSLSCNLGPLTPAASGSVQVAVRAPARGVVVTTASASGSLPDPVMANNVASASVSVVAAAPPPPSPPPAGNCAPSYPDVCIPPPPPDLDCGQIPHRNFRVIYTVASPDPHRFDGDRDGIGCES